MFQDSATTEENYQRFLKRVLEYKKIWGLRHPEGEWATSPSNEYEDVDVYVFWSDEAYARRHCIEDWDGYIPTSIDIDSFIDKWLKGMNEDGFLVGPNWDANLFGKEVEPIEFAKILTSS